MKKWRKLTVGTALVAVLALGGASRVQAAESSGSKAYNNDFVLDSGRLEQGNRANTSQSTETSDLFDQEDADKIEDHEKDQAKQEKKDQEDLFTDQSTPSGPRKDQDLFGQKSSQDDKVIYSQKSQAEDRKQDFSGFFYLILALVLVGGFVYVVYIFLRGEG